MLNRELLIYIGNDYNSYVGFTNYFNSNSLYNLKLWIID